MAAPARADRQYQSARPILKRGTLRPPRFQPAQTARRRGLRLEIFEALPQRSKPRIC